jgi:hypothetical protein
MADNKIVPGSGFFKNITNKLPYQSLDFNAVLSQLNPKYEVFQDTGSRRVEALARQSIFYDNDYNNMPSGSIAKGGVYSDLVYANIQADKGPRILDYRIMAAFAEVADCLDEICDECINKNDHGEIARLHFRSVDLKDIDKGKLDEEFKKYILNFDLERKGWEYFRQLLIEGEIYFEHIIHKNYPEEGILGVVQLPTELIDPIFDNIQNMIIKGYILRKPIFDPNKPNKIEKYEFIPMDKNQITYINSGIWNQDKTFRLPFIENARRAYRQLSLIEDSIVIYRLVRAPERLIFNVDVGNMAPPKAEAYLRKLIQEYWSKKTFDVNQTSNPVQKFNPQSMLDSFWFAKRAGSEGTTVTQLPGGANLGELTDLMYFVNKLYKALKVPTNRLNTESTFKDGNEILREELKFARFIIRLQQNFAAGLKNGFLTHLKLRGLIEKYELKEQNIHIEFNVPTNFYELRENQKLELKVTNFSNLASNPSISQTFAQKKLLGWSDVDIKANREFLRKDKELEWELQQILNGGPNWREQLTLPGQEGEQPPGGAEPGANPQTPPPFGVAASAPGGAPPPGGAEAGPPGAPPGGAPAPAPGGPPA